MADARKEFEGFLTAYTLRLLPVAVWLPAELLKAGELNPFGPAESEAMKAHKASWNARRIRAMAGG